MSSLDRDASPLADVDPVPGLPSTVAAVDADPELDTRKLFAVSRRRVILHQGERYCLQLTRAGKLLLTK